uniref:Uncharacterized protein n=1 Tax=Anguilla anguilla TaxID=7936 RepID=A0A0E9W6Q2_ANGAN
MDSVRYTLITGPYSAGHMTFADNASSPEPPKRKSSHTRHTIQNRKLGKDPTEV